jgi:transcriptional regulator with XRE-family HTH domain
MKRGLATLTGGQGSRAIGVVSGHVLKLARQSAALTQEKLAEVLSVDVTTIQGWESGRRPLAAMNAGDFLRVCGRLARLGAPASTGRHLREAIEADQVLSTGITAGATWVDADTHPLAVSVYRWTITNLITWPITGKRPQHLHQFASKLSRRGPAPTYPALGADERTRFLDHLLRSRRKPGTAASGLTRRRIEESVWTRAVKTTSVVAPVGHHHRSGTPPSRTSR